MADAPSPVASSDAANLPSYTRPEVTAAADDLGLVHDLLAGTRAMQANARTKRYVPKWADEDEEVYKIRSACETVFEGLGRTLSAATGMLFAKAPQVDWRQSETAFGDQRGNVDGAGTALEVFVKRFAEASLRDGLGVLLIDHPAPPKGENGEPVTITAATEQEFNLRPTWARYSRGQIINWRFTVIHNELTPTLLVFSERADVEDGAFGLTTVQRYRVLRLILTPDGYQATWKLYEVQGDAGKLESYVVKDAGAFKNRDGVVRDTLPVAIAYTGRSDTPMCATIPLLGVAWANLAHWQQSTDLRFYRMLSAFPQPTIEGELAQQPGPNGNLQAGTLKLGPAVGVMVTQGSKFGWTEIQGTSMQQLENGIKEKLQQIGQLGMSFLVMDTRAAETAEAKRLDATAENSTLATAAQGIEDAVNSALSIHAWYLGIEDKQAPTMSLSKDYESTTLDAQTMAVYVDMCDKLHFPLDEFVRVLIAGGRLPADADVDTIVRAMRLAAGAEIPNEMDPAALQNDSATNLAAARARLAAAADLPAEVSPAA